MAGEEIRIMVKTSISVEEMMEAGMHFGHQTHRRNPKMDPYIFDVRSGVHIIDLAKTEGLLKKAIEFTGKVAGEGKQVILVGTKRQAAPLIKNYGEKCGMPYVDGRWLGGLLTNFKTIKKRLDYLKELDIRYTKKDFAGMTKKERVMLDKRYHALEASLGGLRNLGGLPGAIFVGDVMKDRIAVLEARKIGIPIVAVVDTNVDPGLVDYPIPANDDAKKSIEYVVKLIAEACAVKPKAEDQQVSRLAGKQEEETESAGEQTSEKEDVKAAVAAKADVKLKEKK